MQLGHYFTVKDFPHTHPSDQLPLRLRRKRIQTMKEKKRKKRLSVKVSFKRVDTSYYMLTCLDYSFRWEEESVFFSLNYQYDISLLSHNTPGWYRTNFTSTFNNSGQKMLIISRLRLFAAIFRPLKTKFEKSAKPRFETLYLLHWNNALKTDPPSLLQHGNWLFIYFYIRSVRCKKNLTDNWRVWLLADISRLWSRILQIIRQSLSLHFKPL